MTRVKPMKFSQLDYYPAHGEIRVRGHRHEWCVKVDLGLGRNLEDDGIEVYWIYAEIPNAVADAGLSRAWVVLCRFFCWPNRVISRLMGPRQ
ncbi:hypothetical protein PhaeoP75_02308 [Phaeobacter gallaeciensis]|uniref:Uncharacterized protein n=1 Tax=Phaeobacter gallaeciensis TaxID=60890 RepID=A0AAC9ZA17_9RHOB|nr:hypothetical protein Gal_02268 [Phaeobacter gallaeciensis DSM 26640]ATE93279.1 hypothetical protein PhaeoP11_02259 [Phaeobacter gallaeciensis]ATE96900.1 hypothetical protein PhaeoP73_01588 [Phaeobacter gallaeciensis]ATF01943.1 hypothetical protein PhaeoP75_02308 [Phaeobacter gallaeciensis]ATF06323.1 hypothetical protein PhaeoP63_02257 [Phaeobacter gallaeciensis]